MKFLLCLFLFSLSSPILFAQRINLADAVRNNRIDVVNRELTPLDDGTHPGIHLSKAPGEGIAWLKGVEFGEGEIEFDVRGEDIKQHSFVGLAFHGQNDTTYDAIYLRPFHFRTEDTLLKERMIQYISLPTYTWRKLRAETPGKYENNIPQFLDPNGWVHMRIVVEGRTISTYINHEEKPSLVVEKVTSTKKGRVGFYVADTSGGDFANIRIEKNKGSG